MAEEIMLDALMDEIFSELPDLRHRWEATEAKREIAKKLIGMRMAADISQEQIAKVTGWDLSVVEAIEGPFGEVPSVDAVGIYMQACGRNVNRGKGSEAQVQNDAQRLIEEMKQHAKEKSDARPPDKKPPVKYRD